jgi:hypothetical protein
MPPTDLALPQGSVSIVSKDPSRLDVIHGWIHDRSYDPADVNYRSDERVLEVPFLCTVYQTPVDYSGSIILASWWVPVVRGYLRFHSVREYSVSDKGYGMINEIVATPGDFRVTGVSGISGRVDAFEVSVDVRDRIIGWVRMRSVLLAEFEGPLQAYDERSDDLKRA